MTWKLSRGQFLVLAASASATGVLLPRAVAADSAPHGTRWWLEQEGLVGPADHVLEVTRSEDFASFWIVLTNVQATRPAFSRSDDTIFSAFEWRFVRENDDDDAFISFVFPPQHLLEQRFTVTGANANCGMPSDAPAGAAPVLHSLSQSSRLVFQAPKSFTSKHYYGFPLTLDAIIEACFGRFWPLVYSRSGGPASARTTAIEFPTRMQLAPSALPPNLQSLFKATPSTSADDVNLSVTQRLPESSGLILPEPVARQPIWGLDLAADAPLQVFGVGQRPVDDHSDACSLVQALRADVCGSGNAVTATRFRLSALGMTASTAYQQTPVDLATGFASWTEVTQDGRDVSVVITYAGWLYPWGIPATYVEAFTRESRQAGDSNFYAYGVCRATIVLQDTTASFADADGAYRAVARGLAAQSVDVGPRVSPPIQRACNSRNIIDSGSPSDPVPAAFVPDDITGQRMYRFTVTHHGIALDTCVTTKPLIFVRASTSCPIGPRDPSARSYIQNVIDPQYRSLIDDGTQNALRTFEWNRQPFTYVSAPASADATALQQHRKMNAVTAITHDYAFQFSATNANRELSPVLDNITIDLPAVSQVASLGGSVTLTMDPNYVANSLVDGIEDASEVYATLVAPVASLQNVASEYRTGIAAINLQPAALSRSLGVLVLDTATNSLDTFLGNPSLSDLRGKLHLGDFFPDSARLFGLQPLSLKNLLAQVELPSLPDLPRFGPLSIDGNCVGFRHETSIKELAGYIAARDGSGKIEITLAATVCPPSANEPNPVRTASVTMGKFTLPMLPPITDLPEEVQQILLIDFDSIEVTITNGRAAVTPHIAGVRLNPESALQILSWLDNLISGDSPLHINLSSDSIGIALNLALPDIGAGAFTLSGVTIDISTDLPLSDLAPSFSLAIGTPTNPVTVLLAFLGGGGWFQITLSPFAVACGGVPQLAIGGGANVSAGIDINLFDVVEGYVQANAGVFYESEFGPNGYLKFGGSLVIAGGISAFHLISVSMYVEIDFNYSNTQGMTSLSGSAQYHVEVDMLFFSASFDCEVSYSMPVGSPDPRYSKAGGSVATALACAAARVAALR